MYSLIKFYFRLQLKTYDGTKSHTFADDGTIYYLQLFSGLKLEENEIILERQWETECGLSREGRNIKKYFFGYFTQQISGKNTERK